MTAEMAPGAPVPRRVSWRLHSTYPRKFGVLRWIETPTTMPWQDKPERQFHVTDDRGIWRVIPARFITYEE